jgi:hypothetical protein
MQRGAGTVCKQYLRFSAKSFTFLCTLKLCLRVIQSFGWARFCIETDLHAAVIVFPVLHLCDTWSAVSGY